MRLGEEFETVAESLVNIGFDSAAFTTATWLSRSFGVVQGFENLDTQLESPSNLVVDRALKWLDDRGNRPLFLFLHLFDVHDYTSPPEFEALYVDPDYDGVLRGRARSMMSNSYDELSREDLAYAVDQYDAALRFVDAELGRLFAGLRTRGRFENALIIVTSDHGEEFWEHGGSGHGFTLYDDQLRVPLIVKPPANEVVTVSVPQMLASTVDLAPTILDYAGVASAKERFEGISLRPAIEGGDLPPRRSVFAETTYFFNTYAVVEESHKYIHNRVPSPMLAEPALLLSNIRSFYKFRGSELYDLSVDPDELENREGAADSLEASLRDQLLDHVSRMQRVQAMDLSEKLRQQLRALGYVE